MQSFIRGFKSNKMASSLLDVREMHAPGPQELGFFPAFFVQGFRFEPAAGSLLHEARPSQSAVLAAMDRVEGKISAIFLVKLKSVFNRSRKLDF